MTVSDELRDLAHRLGGDRPTDEQWHAGAKTWVDRLTALLGGSEAFLAWIVPRVPFSYSRPWRGTGHFEFVQGDPRIVGTVTEHKRWFEGIESYAWRQMIAGITPDMAVLDRSLETEYKGDNNILTLKR